MIEGNPQRSVLLGRLHQGLQGVFSEVSTRDASVVHGPEIILSIGELSEMRIDPRKAALERAVTYFFYNFRADHIPEQRVVEEEIASSIAITRTDRVKKAQVVEADVFVQGQEGLPY